MRARRDRRRRSWLEVAPTKHGRVPIKHGRFPVKHGRSLIKHGRSRSTAPQLVGSGASPLRQQRPVTPPELPGGIGLVLRPPRRVTSAAQTPWEAQRRLLQGCPRTEGFLLSTTRHPDHTLCTRSVNPYLPTQYEHFPIRKVVTCSTILPTTGLSLPSAGKAFLLGASSALLSSPCSSPVLATLLTFCASTGSPLLGSATVDAARHNQTEASQRASAPKPRRHNRCRLAHPRQYSSRRGRYNKRGCTPLSARHYSFVLSSTPRTQKHRTVMLLLVMLFCSAGLQAADCSSPTRWATRAQSSPQLSQRRRQYYYDCYSSTTTR